MAQTKLKARGVSLLCEELAMLLAGGAGGAEALDLLSRDAGGLMGQVLSRAAKAADEGRDLAGALADTGALPDYACRLLEAGQGAGRTQETLEALAEYYDKQDALAVRLKNALIYPVALLLFMCLILLVLVRGVLPVFEGVYDSLSGSLAASSYGYITVAGGVGWAALVLVGLFCLALLAGAGASRVEALRPGLGRLLEKLPGTGPALRQLALARCVGALRALLASGLREDDALRQARPLCGHSALAKTLEVCQQEMDEGESLAQTFYAHRVLSPLYGRMLLSGSRAGRLEETLGRLAEVSARDAEEKIYALVDGAEPLLTGFLTLSVGAVLLSVMLPLAGILTAMG